MKICIELYDATTDKYFGNIVGPLPVPRIGEQIELTTVDGSPVVRDVTNVVHVLPRGTVDIPRIRLYVR